MYSWMIWAIMLFFQTASFTWTSRARNSGSIAYHSLASSFSNSIWIAGMYFVVDKLRDAHTMSEKLTVVLFYTACTVAGAASMHWFSMKYLEKGKRRVGS